MYIHALGLFGLVCTLLTVQAQARDYYIASSGDDRSDGSSPEQAWRTLAPVNAIKLEPGDRVLLEGGTHFTDSVFIDRDDCGSAEAPVTITSFGPGRAVIDAGDSFGIYVYDCGGIEISDLEVRGSGLETNRDAGIRFYTDRADGAKLEHIRVRRMEVSGFLDGGIILSAWHESYPGYRDVEITHSVIRDNGDAGIAVWGYWHLYHVAYAHEDLYIAHVHVENNGGNPYKTDGHTGNGIVIAGVDGAVIEYCTASYNGWLNSFWGGGPVGIWAWDAHRVTIQFNVSHHNQTGGGADGGGFDFNGGTTDSLMQHNLSYENDGAGYLLTQFSGAHPYGNNVIRHNVSINDGRKNGYAGIHLWSSGSNGGIQQVQIYGNRVRMRPADTGSPRAVLISSGGISDVLFTGNRFVTSDGLTLVEGLTLPGVRFAGNRYQARNGPFHIRWDGVDYDSVEAWREATGQEIEIE